MYRYTAISATFYVWHICSIIVITIWTGCGLPIIIHMRTIITLTFSIICIADERDRYIKRHHRHGNYIYAAEFIISSILLHILSVMIKIKAVFVCVFGCFSIRSLCAFYTLCPAFVVRFCACQEAPNYDRRQNGKTCTHSPDTTVNLHALYVLIYTDLHQYVVIFHSFQCFFFI